MTTPRRPRQIVEAEGRRAILVAGDLGDKDVLRGARCRRSSTRSARLDILVNNAGEQHPDEDIRDITEEQLKRTFQTNIYSMFFMVQAARPHLKKGAAIINCTSITMYKGCDEPARLFGDQGRDHRLHPLAVAKPRRATASASTRSRRGRSGPRSTRSAASRPRRSPTSARTRRWAARASPTRSRRPSCSSPARIQQLHDGPGAPPQWRDRSSTANWEIFPTLSRSGKFPTQTAALLIFNDKIQLARSLQYEVEPHRRGRPKGRFQMFITTDPRQHRRQPRRRFPHRHAVRQRRRRPASDRLTHRSRENFK